MAPEFVIPYDALAEVGSRLASISENLGAGTGPAPEAGGLDDPAHIPIITALDDFRSEWEASVHTLGANIATLGGISGQIGALVGAFDDAVAGALFPTGAVG